MRNAFFGGLIAVALLASSMLIQTARLFLWFAKGCAAGFNWLDNWAFRAAAKGRKS